MDSKASGTGSRRRVRLGIAAGGLVITLGYIAIVGCPYLRSTLVRDAAVTTWISTTASLVSGYVKDPLYPGDRIGADGRIAVIVDVQADATALARAEAELFRVHARHELQKRVVDVARHSYDARASRAEGFTTAFIQNLDAAITSVSSNLTYASQQLDLAKAELTRKEALARAGHGSQTATDTSGISSPIISGW